VTPDEAVESIVSTLGRGQEVRLSRSEDRELRQFLADGYERASDRGDMERFNYEVGVLAGQLMSATQLVALEGADFAEVEIAGGLGEILRKMCPIWPFCR